MKPRLALIGPGRLGQAVTARLREAGYPISAVIGRDLNKAQAAARFIGAELMATDQLRRCAAAQAILIAVADDAIAEVAGHLHASGLVTPHTLLVHFSGLHPAQILVGPAENPCLALHPLQTFASAAQGKSALEGCTYSLQGDALAVESGQQLVADLGGQAFILPAEMKARYHAAACLVSNYVTTLVAEACQLLAEVDGADELFPRALGPLLQTAVANTLTMGPQQALTGPIVRGDSGTLALHLSTLAEQCPQQLPLYRELARRTLDLAARSERLSKEDQCKLSACLDSRDEPPSLTAG
ncbi:MAG: DUF2520 domain-containing protein [Desulfuromonadaceae bacterium]|nr:DUF2520 domain-containing protein [Desulfuromonadaceae bacterium]